VTLSPAEIRATLDATWPPASVRTVGHWQLRQGAGGGKRVSATSPLPGAGPDDIDLAETEMRAAGQPPLFVIDDSADPLDAALAARGYALVDPTVALSVPVGRLTDVPIPRLTTFEIWEPLAIMEEIWDAGGIGPARRAVMARAETKTAIFARLKDKPAGTAFVALHDHIAMVHAVEVLAAFRRQGVAGWIMRAAAFWAQDKGATTIAVLCTRQNTAALALYSALGFTEGSGYHYRALETEGS
jgi:GNAT superfamily N-acetyltransferase